MKNYILKDFATGREFADSGWLLDDPQGQQPSLIRAIYDKKQITFGPTEEGVYRFSDWLPIVRQLKGSHTPVTYKSEALARELDLQNLYITLSGYHPERGALMTTCSFKETEAYSVCGRMSPQQQAQGKVLVVASAGNTARAFARVCSDNDIPLLLCVPQDNLEALWFDEPIKECVRLVAPASGADYFDAIHIGNLAVESPKFYAEGGAKNIARRDGMATTMLSATETIGQIPDYYFQAVGSGTGAIAAWEANLRLIQDGRWGNNKCRLIVSQNAPFLPMYDAWKANSRALLPFDDQVAREQVEQINAKVLSNRRPPYAIAGGLFDALKDSQGDIVCADNQAAHSAAQLFLKLEGVDINPAAAIALATLIDWAKAGKIKKNANVMLNITGAGEQKLKHQIQTSGRKPYMLTPSIVFPLPIPPAQEVIAQISALF